jgi:hypothetical protein
MELAKAVQFGDEEAATWWQAVQGAVGEEAQVHAQDDEGTWEDPEDAKAVPAALVALFAEDPRLVWDYGGVVALAQWVEDPRWFVATIGPWIMYILKA